MSQPLPVLQLLFASFLFGASNVAQKLVFEDLDAWSSLGFRGFFAILVLAPVAIFELRRLNLPFLAVFKASVPVAVFFFLGMTAQLFGATQTSATNVGFLINTCVVFTPFLLWIMTGERPTLAIVATAAVCFIGVTVLSGSAPTAFSIGDMFCIVSAMGYAGWIIALCRTMSDVKAPVTVTIVQWVAPAIIGLAIGGPALEVANVVAQLPNLLFLGMIVGGFGFMLAAKAQERLSPCTAAVCYSMEAVFGALVAFVWSGETLTTLGMVGAAITLSSIVLVQCVPATERVRTVQVRIEPRFV
jgi:drug/metabolite transporter (DMT)-like permease